VVYVIFITFVKKIIYADLQNCSYSHVLFYNFPGGKGRPERDADLSQLSSAELKNE
jgi:hypothetical protein